MIYTIEINGQRTVELDLPAEPDVEWFKWVRMTDVVARLKRIEPDLRSWEVIWTDLPAETTEEAAEDE